MIYFQRHGESETNVKKIFTCRKIDPELTDHGQQQIKNKIPYFESRNIKKIISSPSKRAIQSANIIGEALKIEVQKNENLLEINIGDLEGKSEMDPVHLDSFFQILTDWQINHVNSRFTNGESKSEMDIRVKNIFSIAESDTIYVCHAGFIACAMAIYSFPFKTIQDLFLPRAGTATYSLKERVWEIIK
ncbi:histidine phosphatase family protein [bacterium]|nr:histidine phosphatase family protein [bacterium]